jgi:hypothetical protein
MVVQPRQTTRVADAPPQDPATPAPIAVAAQDTRNETTQANANPTELMHAIDGGLAWLAHAQESDGHFDCKKFGGVAGQDVAVTSIAGITLLGAGHTRKIGPFKETVKKLVMWLEQQPPPAEITQAALRALALAESVGMSRLGQAEAQAAVDELITRQNITGEWLDENGKGAYARSVSPTTWAVLALKSAKVAGLKIPQGSLDQAVKSFEIQQSEVMSNEDNIAGAKMAAGLAVQRQFSGWKKDDPLLLALVNLLPKQRPVYPSDGIGHEAVFWFQGSLAMFNQGGEGWTQWWKSVRVALIPSQIKEGELAGSWDFRQGSDPFLWGRVGSTALATLPLEVEARYEQLQPDTVRIQAEKSFKKAPDSKPATDDAGF